VVAVSSHYLEGGGEDASKGESEGAVID
jgi:hypothetical protein